MISQVLSYPIADILFTLYLLVYFPFEGIRNSLVSKVPKPALPVLQSYWKQGRYILILLAVFVLVCWQEQHSASQLGLAIPPTPAGIWGLGIVLALLMTLHILGKRAESKLTPQDRITQQEKMRELPFPMPQTGVEIAAYFITMVGMTTVWEVFFRGYLLLVLTPHTGLPLAVILAAVSYGAGHGYKSLKQFIGSIGVSLAFTIGYALTGSLWWLIVLHAAAPTMMFFAVRKLNQATSVEVISA